MSRMERKQMYGKERLVQLHVTGIYVCHIKAFEASHIELFFFFLPCTRSPFKVKEEEWSPGTRAKKMCEQGIMMCAHTLGIT